MSCNFSGHNLHDNLRHDIFLYYFIAMICASFCPNSSAEMKNSWSTKSWNKTVMHLCSGLDSGDRAIQDMIVVSGESSQQRTPMEKSFQKVFWKITQPLGVRIWRTKNMSCQCFPVEVRSLSCHFSQILIDGQKIMEHPVQTVITSYRYITCPNVTFMVSWKVKRKTFYIFCLLGQEAGFISRAAER